MARGLVWMRFEKIMLLVLCLMALGAVSVFAQNQTLTQITLSPSVVSLKVGDTQLFTATCYYTNGTNPNTTYPGPCPMLSWTSSAGTMNPTSSYYSSTLTVTTYSQADLYVTASSGGVQGIATVRVLPSSVLTMAAYPTSIPAGGGFSLIYATLTLNGTPLVNQTIKFTTTLGAIWQTYASTNASGVATNRLYPGGTPGLATVTGMYNGTYGYATNYVNVNITPASSVLATIVVTPNPANVAVGGTQQFTATCRDQYNTTLFCPMLQWTTNAGTMNPAYSTSTSTLTARTSPGTGLYVRATVFNTTNGTYGQATVNIVPGSPALANLTANPTSLFVGQFSTITAYVYDAYGNCVADGTSVTFNKSGVGYFVNGSLGGQYAVIPTMNCKASVVLGSSDVGTATIMTPALVSNSVSVTFLRKVTPPCKGPKCPVPVEVAQISLSPRALDANSAATVIFLLAFAGLIATYYMGVGKR